MVRIGYAGKPVSQATISKLSTATYKSGTLRQGGDGRAPDGGAIVDYPKGWRFLPTEATPEEKEILKKNSAVAYALMRLSELTGAGRESDATGSQTDHHKTVNDAYYNLVIAPQIKAQQELEAREEEEQRQTIATLKMRVHELEKPTPVPVYENNTDANWSLQKTTSYLPLVVVGIVIAVILLFLRRRA